MEKHYYPEGDLWGREENRAGLASRAALEKAAQQGRILESVALKCDEDMTLTFDLNGIPGILTREEALFCRPGEERKDIAIITRVGKPVCFKVIGFERRGGQEVALLSRRAAQAECFRQKLSGLVPGDILPARVTHMERYGAFVDIGCGLISLLSVDCISVSRISHPSERLECGQSLYCVVRQCNPESGRIFVSLRELLGTWEENAALFSPGQTVAGIIRSIESYGAFVELTPNLAGLAELRPGLCAGQSAAVYIKSILPQRMKIKLVLIDARRDVPERRPLRYFIDTARVSHLDRWRYSPPSCEKVTETNFCDNFL